MAQICPVCYEEITSENREVYKSSNDSEGVALHDYCLNKYVSKPKKYVGKTIEAEKSRAEICPVCDEGLYTHVNNVWYPISGIKVHDWCNNIFRQDPENYGGVTADLDVSQSDKEQEEKRKIDEASLQEIQDKSVYIKDLDIPIKSMVIFMVKWAIASIPAFIILAIIGAIFFAIFGALFF